MHTSMGKFTAYKIPLQSLGVGSHHFDFKMDKQFFVNMESTDVHDADLDASTEVTYNGDFYSISFHITGEVVLICDRCLDDLHYPIDEEYNIVVKYGDDYNDDNDEVLEIPKSDTTLNVAYMLYDTVTLAIPIKHVHPLGKCNRQMSAMLKKHRATNGDEDSDLENELIDEIDNIDAENEKQERATDPRWDALKKLGGEESQE